MKQGCLECKKQGYAQIPSSSSGFATQKLQQPHMDEGLTVGEDEDGIRHINMLRDSDLLKCLSDLNYALIGLGQRSDSASLLDSTKTWEFYRCCLELILGAVDIQHGCEPDEQPPPWPVADTHKLAHVLLDAADGDILGLQRQQRSVFHQHLPDQDDEYM